MLVYCKDYLGYSSINGKLVYGRGYNRGRFGPTEISYAEYLQNANSIEKIPYTKQYLDKKHKKNFPHAEFYTWHDLKKYGLEILTDFATLLDIDWKNRRSLSESDIEGLAQAIYRKLSE